LVLRIDILTGGGKSSRRGATNPSSISHGIVFIIINSAGLAPRLEAMPRRNSTIGKVTTMRGIFGSAPVVNSLVVASNANGFRVLALNVLRN
jgi:hypothetical protein